jgi:hypothetical protein
MTIQLSGGPSMLDPYDQAPIAVVGLHGVTSGVITLAAIGWRARLAVWLLRSYVKRCVKSA